MIKHCRISSSDLDVWGNCDFKLDMSYELYEAKSGGWPYHKPIGWKRIGMNTEAVDKPTSNGPSDEWAIMYLNIITTFDDGWKSPSLCRSKFKAVSSANIYQRLYEAMDDGANKGLF